MKLHIDPPNDFNSLYIKRVQEIFYFMTNYSQSANPNATNSELDAKVIIKHPQLTSAQKEDLIEQFVEIVVDGMDMKTLVQYVSDDLIHFYENKCDDIELKEFIDNHDDELYDELVDNVTQQYPKQLNTFEKETFIDINNTGGQF